MATEKQRGDKLKKDIAAGEKSLGGILSRRKRAVTGAVAQFAGTKGFSTSATVRNGLYSELAKEYQTLNTDINKWTVDSVDDTAKQWWGYAKDDLPAGKVATFGAFSEKHVQDIIGRINPASIGEQVAVNAQIGGMLQNDIRVLRSAVSTTIAEGAVEGLTNKQLADRMKSKVIDAAGSFKFIDAAGRRQSADNYFGMLNRTLHATAARDSYIATATDAGFDLYQIEGGVTGSSADNPSDPCDQWAGRIISMTGQTKGYPTYQDAISAGVFHPQCCVSETEVICPDLQAASRFKYSGQMVKIKYASGNTLSVTPNHMLLTDQGFAPACSLAKGDNVLRRIEGNGLGGGSPDVEREPSTIKDVFMAVWKCGGVLATKMPVSAEDFHGDGEFGNGDVDVVFADRLLLDDTTGNPITKPLGKHGFAFADIVKFPFVGDSSLAKVLLCLAGATNRIVSGLGVRHSPVCAPELLGKDELIGFAPDVYTCGNKGVSDSVLIDMQNFADFPVSESAIIERDYVVGVDMFRFSGHVYDLQCLSTLYYANGYVSSNCVHFIRAIMPSEIKAAKVEQKAEKKEAKELPDG